MDCTDPRADSTEPRGQTAMNGRLVADDMNAVDFLVDNVLSDCPHQLP
jgi:hypothetical protein